MSGAFVRISTGIGLWALAMWGALEIRHLPGDWSHVLCGPWGCAPPLKAVVAYQLFWAVVWLPVLATVSSKWPGRSWRVAGGALIAAPILIIVGLCVEQAFVWLPHVTPELRTYFWRRCAFRVVTAVDVPLVALLGGGILLALPRSGPSRATPSDASSPAATSRWRCRRAARPGP